MMPDGILYSNLLLKMYLMSLKHNGILLLHENLPHTPQTIATFTRHQIGTVERALQIFLKTRLCRAADRWRVLYAGYPAAGRAILHRSGAKTPGTAAFTKHRSSCPTQKADICPPENRDKEIREQKRARTNIRTYEVTEEDVV